jgi:CDP-6-deoxy-D-xylo-4-hexulose-3-dehydrase
MARTLQPGELITLRWPFTDLNRAKNRPALVLTEPDSRGDIEVAMITSQLADPASLLIAESDYMTSERLPLASAVRVDRVLLVAADIVQRLSVALRPQVVAAVRKRVILSDTRQYSALVHAGQRPGDDAAHAPWVPGQTIPYAGRVFNQDEVEAAVGSTLDFWLTLGPEGEAFERELAALLGVKYSLLVNSGSSANLVALATLTTHKLPAHKRIQPGDEVITVAAGFPTTVSPILQLGAVPVFIDNDPITGNIRADQLASAYVAGKTKAVMIAHALGNPFDLSAVLEFCKTHDLWLIEDNCDALGCTYSLPVTRAKALGLDHLLKLAEANGAELRAGSLELRAGSLELRAGSLELRAGSLELGAKSSELGASSSLLSAHSSELVAPGSLLSDQGTQLKIPFIKNGILTAYTGSFGDISTQSFYPPHHLTMGEGGAVNIISKPPLKTYAESFRDWGRDCWCPSGKDDTCCKRFGWQLGELPKGYDHKYIYSHLGYNLKPLDPQAAIGRQQLKKLPAFIEARKQNWETLRAGLADLDNVFDFTLPSHAVRWIPPGERTSAANSGELGAKSQEEGAKCLELHAPSSQHQAQSTKLAAPSAFEWDSSGNRTDTSWFGFMLRVKPTAPFSHSEFARHLNEKNIGNRMFFGGNLLRQPVFVQLRKDRPEAIRLVGAKGATITPVSSETISAAFPGADAIMNEAIFLGTYPGLTPAMLAYEIQVIRNFVMFQRANQLKVFTSICQLPKKH